MEYICSECNKKEPVDTKKACCDCGGLFKLEYEHKKFDLDLVDKTTWGLFRYKEFIPLLDESYKEVSLGEGLSPIINFDEDLMLKLDYLMTTLSFKDRGAAVLISHAKSIGVKEVVQDSSGNAGNSIAAYAARADIKCEIYVPENTSTKKIDMIKSHNAKVHIIEGSRDNCANVCREAVMNEGKYYASHVYNPFFYEGTKTYIFEIYEQLGRIPKNIFVPLGNGTLFIGVIKGLEELIYSGIIDKMPNVVAIQSENCDPFVQAVLNRKTYPVEVDVKPTMAEGIAIGEPKRGKEILDYIYKYNLKVITAPENMIKVARKELSNKGIFAEPTAAANYAGYKNYCIKYGKTTDSIIPICGSGLKSDEKM